MGVLVCLWRGSWLVGATRVCDGGSSSIGNSCQSFVTPFVSLMAWLVVRHLRFWHLRIALLACRATCEFLWNSCGVPRSCLGSSSSYSLQSPTAIALEAVFGQSSQLSDEGRYFSGAVRGGHFYGSGMFLVVVFGTLITRFKEELYSSFGCDS